MAMMTSVKGVRPFLLNPLQPLWSLTLVFVLWKSLLFLVVTACPGPGYDTSTSLLPYLNRSTGPAADVGAASGAFPLKFIRWDPIYFVHIVQHGYVYEQEWAFGYGFTSIWRFFASLLNASRQVGNVAQVAWVGVGLSHLAHYLSVLALYRLSANVFGHETPTQRLVSFLSATLHIIAPAGAFLSAPYPEPIFSFLNIFGYYLYSSSFIDDGAGRRFSRDSKLLGAAVFFAVATTVRSNGILSGFLFAYDAIWQLRRLLLHGLSFDVAVRLAVIIVGGFVVALGLVLPQWVAYTTYCTDNRPWCQWTIPSIYGWVQGQYWNVGFLRYWTVSNIPLFLLATPMLILLCCASLWALKMPWNTAKDRPLTVIDRTMSPAATDSLLIRLAVPQGLLAVMAFTSYHVQIINRISSGYPLWYWYLVCLIVGDSSAKSTRLFTMALQAMVGYALIQAVLYGSFLPPA